MNGGFSLHFLGVGSALAVELGASSAVLERAGTPLLMIDCGQEALTAFLNRYRTMPPALFITHVHLDHVAGLERLFVHAYFEAAWRGQVRLYVPASVVPLLQGRIADYPEVLAEGSANFWDAFRLIPVSRGFWHEGLWFDVFPTRHHAPGTSFGIRLSGAFIFTGDTRPIPETLAALANHELIAHDCGLIGNPSHTGLDDLEREYPATLRQRMMLYHYGSKEDGAALTRHGYRVAIPGMTYPLPEPSGPRIDA